MHPSPSPPVHSPVSPPPPQSVEISFAGRPVTWLGLIVLLATVAPAIGLAVTLLAWTTTYLPRSECVMWGVGGAVVAAATMILAVQFGVFRSEATRQYRRARRLLRSPQELAALPDREVCELILRGHAIAPDRLASIRYRHIAQVEQAIGRRLPRVWIEAAARRHDPIDPPEQMEASSGTWGLYWLKEYPAGSVQIGPDRLLPMDLAALALGVTIGFQLPHGRLIAFAGAIPYWFLREWLYPQRWWLALQDRHALLVNRLRHGPVEREIPLDLDECFVVVTERQVRQRSLLGRIAHGEGRRYAHWLILRPDPPHRLTHALLPWGRGPWAGL